MKCTWPTPEFCVGTQRNLYSTGLRLGFASGKTQILGFASGVFAFLDTNMLVSFALGIAKVWRWGSKPTPVPNANGFALQWNIGFRSMNVCKIDTLHTIQRLTEPSGIAVYYNATINQT